MQHFSKFILMLMVLLFFTACHQPTPRKPVSYQSGSFLDESLKRNIALLRAEEKAINEIIENDSLNTYFN